MQAALRAVEKKQLPHMLCVTNMLLHGVEDPSFVRHDNTLARPYISYGQSDRVDIVLTNPPFGGREEDGIESNFPKQFQTRETADLFLALIIRLLKKDGRAAVVLPDGIAVRGGRKDPAEGGVDGGVQPAHHRPPAQQRVQTLRLHRHQSAVLRKGEPTKDIWFYEHQVPTGQKAYSMTKPIRLEHFQSCIDWWGGKDRKDREETPQAWRVTGEAVKARGYNLDIKNPHSIADDHGDPETLLADLARAEAEAAGYRNQLKAILAEALAG